MTLLEEFRDIIKELVEEALIEEKESLLGLAKNFEKVFPASRYDDLRPEHRKVYGEDTTELKIVTQIRGSKKDQAYSTVLVLRRNDLDEEWNADMMAEVKCSCPAFKYYNANADWKSKNFYGRPDKWAKVSPKKLNLSGTPTMCKHLMRATKQAIEDGIIEK